MTDTTAPPKADVKSIKARLAAMKAARVTTDAQWQQVADYVLPSREFTRASIPGQKRSVTLIYNTRPVTGVEKLAAHLHGMMTSPALRWFALAAEPDMVHDDDVRGWFEVATDVMYAHFQNSDAGLDVALHENYLDLVGFGQDVLYIEDGGREGAVFAAVPLAECYIAEDSRRRVDTLYRSYTMPLREVVANTKWRDKLPLVLLRQSNEAPDRPINIIHACEPNLEKTEWCGTYVVEDTIVEEGSYKDFPYAVARWSKRSGEVNGYGPAMTALPDIKLVNKFEELILRGLGKTVDPAIMLPDDGFLSTVTTQPGGVNYFRSDARNLDKIGPMPTGAKPEIGERKVEMIEKRIEEAFYLDWLSLPQQPNMTATEVLHRRDEYFRLLGPMVARITMEKLSKIIKRTFGILARNGMFPPPPPQLVDRGYSVSWLSPLAKAQKSSDAETVLRFFAAVAQIAQVDPTATKAVNAEASVRFLADRYGVPVALLHTQQEMVQVRAQADQQAQAMQQQQQMESLATAAGAAKDGAGALAGVQQALGGQPPGAMQPQAAA